MDVFLDSTGIVGVAEMGDKTQIATVMLAARHDAYFWRVAGITLGMMPGRCTGGLARQPFSAPDPLRFMRTSCRPWLLPCRACWRCWNRHRRLRDLRIAGCKHAAAAGPSPGLLY